MGEYESTPLEVALREAEKRAVNSGEEAEVETVLECARKENLVEFGREPSDDERARGKMAEALGVRGEGVDGRVVGQALVRAVEGGFVNVVRRLRKGQMELRCSVLAPRFLAFALLRASEVGSFEAVQELMRTTDAAALAMVGNELELELLALPKRWQATLRELKALLPPAIYALRHSTTLELQSAVLDQEPVHEALRSCYQIYALWRLMVVAGVNNHGDVLRELLMKRAELAAQADEAKGTLIGNEHPTVSEMNNSHTQIDEAMKRFVMKLTAKLRHDALLYEVWKSTEGDAIAEEQGEEKESKAQLGLWEVTKEVPVLLMDLEGAYERRKVMRRYRYIKPIIPQMVKINLQLKVVIEVQPNYCELTVGINHVRVTVENQCWEEAQTGHFPTRVSLVVTPVTTTLTSVSMTGSSVNTARKVGVGEQLRVGAQATLKQTPTVAVSVQAAKSTYTKVEGKPWRMEQLPVYNERGGSYTFSLISLHGQGFDRLSPMLQASKRSIWHFGKRVPVNPLLVLPFGTNGGVNFTGSEFDDTLSWRFSNHLEGQTVQFNVEGEVHTTHITKNRFWETRVVPFEVTLDQKLEACGDPNAGDKKKKKKNK